MSFRGMIFWVAFGALCVAVLLSVTERDAPAITLEYSLGSVVETSRL
ncbi:MAG: hypothetical protein AAGA06_10550 [Pseudomonadota bacterium]